MLINIFEYRFLLLDKFDVWNELRNEVVQLCFYWTDRSLYLWWVIDEQTGMSELVSHLYGELSWQLLKEMKDAYQSWYYLQPIKHMKQLQLSSVHLTCCVQKRWCACWTNLCSLNLYDIILAHARKPKLLSLATLKTFWFVREGILMY